MLLRACVYGERLAHVLRDYCVCVCRAINQGSLGLTKEWGAIQSITQWLGERGHSIDLRCGHAVMQEYLALRRNFSD